jgi:predicted regulator of Ras-like GTPase activity (Roadblock/LC7/MglB family)
MHWLAERLEALHDLAERHLRLKGLATVGAVENIAADTARRAYFTALTDTAEQVKQRPGVSACFVCHDGLLFAQAGEASSFEALAAVTQQCMEVARLAAESAHIGEVRQMVLVGSDGKLALFYLGHVAVGIHSAVDVNLALSLSA